jgi:tRNA pseudouridine55 synthase
VIGLLLVDKPAGPTSHDVVARLRRTSGERRIGHTGTLDPRATGLLVLLFGAATRLATFVAAGVKTYEATIRLGFATTTDDAEGEPLSNPATELPADDEVKAALAQFRGSLDQLPPRFSAKHVDGERAYQRARQAEPLALAPARVEVHALTFVERTADLVRVRLTVSAGFYVRAFARDLGTTLGCGAHLHELRRTASGGFDLADAVALADAERLGPAIGNRLVAPVDALQDFALVRLTPTGLTRARHGNAIGPDLIETPPVQGPRDRFVRLVAADGGLVAVARADAGALHPIVVLG